jgi:hypothetical protein
VAVIRPTFPEDHFARVPNAWLRDPNLDPAPKAYLAYLLTHAAGFSCSTSLAARDMGVNRSTVSAWNAKLVERGYFLEVEQSRSAGRFGANDYRITDATDRVPPLPDNPALFPVETARSTDTVGPRTVEPTRSDRVRKTRTQEEQGEKNTPAPTEQGVDGDGRHLRSVDGEQTVGQRANTLAREHYEAVHGLVPFPGLLSIIRRAIDAGGYADERVRKGLALLRETGRPVTLQTLHAALESPDAVAGRRGRPTGPYRDPADPNAYRGAF